MQALERCGLAHADHIPLFNVMVACGEDCLAGYAYSESLVEGGRDVDERMWFRVTGTSPQGPPSAAAAAAQRGQQQQQRAEQAGQGLRSAQEGMPAAALVAPDQGSGGSAGGIMGASPPCGWNADPLLQYTR